MAEPSDARFQGRATRDGQPVPSAMAGRPSDESVPACFGSKLADRVYKPIPGDPLAFASREAATRRTENILEVLSSRPKLRSLQLFRIAIKTKGTILFIDPSDVIAIEAKGNHLLLLHSSGPYLLRESITTAEKKLNRHGFVRIQRSVLINPMFVHELKSWSAGRYVLRIKGGKEYKVTRNYKRNLQLLAESWIGTDGFGAT